MSAVTASWVAGMKQQDPPFDSLASEDRAKAEMAASRFLLHNDYVSLQEAAEQRGISMRQLWHQIITDAGLPACDIPAFTFAT
jgi:hypothetical protein